MYNFGCSNKNEEIVEGLVESVAQKSFDLVVFG
jgi:hypothetical protein